MDAVVDDGGDVLGGLCGEGVFAGGADGADGGSGDVHGGGGVPPTVTLPSTTGIVYVVEPAEFGAGRRM